MRPVSAGLLRKRQHLKVKAAVPRRAAVFVIGNFKEIASSLLNFGEIA